MTKKYFIVLFVLFSFVMVNCNKKEENRNKNNETILKGEVSILVDETLFPVIEDQVAVFESYYDAKVALKPISENEIIKKLVNDKKGVVILTRDLSVEEKNQFLQNKINPKVTNFATDGIVFISNKSSNDTLLALKDVIRFMQGGTDTKIKGLVFDNPNSSTVRYMNAVAKVSQAPEKGVFSFKTNEDVIKYVAENDGMVGVVGLNWLTQPSKKMLPYLEKINQLSVQGKESKEFVYPSQNNIAEKRYPLARDLFIINCQGYSGLGMGFASFMAGDIGQRIILKSGLVPFRTPGRKINVRKEIINDKKNN